MNLKDTLTCIMYKSNNDVSDYKDSIGFCTFADFNSARIIVSSEVIVTASGKTFGNIAFETTKGFKNIKIGSDKVSFQGTSEQTITINANSKNYSFIGFTLNQLEKLLEGQDLYVKVDDMYYNLEPYDILILTELRDTLYYLKIIEKENPILNLISGKRFYNYYRKMESYLADKNCYFTISDGIPFSYIYKTEDMNTAVMEAQASANYFIDEIFKDALRGGSEVLYRAKAYNNEFEDYIWYFDVHYDKNDKNIKGYTLFNDEIYVINEAMIKDWVITPKGEFSEGGYTIKVIRQNLDLKTLAKEAVYSGMLFESENVEGKYKHVKRFHKEIRNKFR